MSNNNSITVAPHCPRAPRGRASTSRQQEDAGTVYDLTALPRTTRTPDVEQQSHKRHYNLSPDALAGYQNQIERHGRKRFECAQPKDKPSPLAPQHGSRVAKVAHLPKQVPSQSNRSRTLASSSVNNPIAIDDQRPRSTNADGTKWCYNTFKAFDPRESIPQLNEAFVKIVPPAPSPSNMHDPGACFLFQVDLARHLAHSGVNGPYELGEFLCDIHKANGGFVKIARRETANGEYFWRHIITGERLQPQDGSDVTGKAVALGNGALFGMQNDQGQVVPPEWTFTEPRIWQFKNESKKEEEVNPAGLKPDCNPMWP
ncbi:hypothetical protein FSARC_742 [Fusarium sarcochroum]|uniref:Uncharacterized protein n=1 Tax=Fusarium sarcochroum TaxID=1208366 RepID=A0A8H4UAN1_9HYPO|nr:hypothetical protein FSARC_742 [Fusarium sarcochroum]